MMTPESKATTATTTKTSTMALAQKTAAAAAAASQSTSTSSSSLHLSTLGIASKAAKAAKSFVSNMHNNNNNNNNTNRNNNNNNNNSSSKKLASVEKMQMQMHKQQQQQQQQQHQRQQQQQQQNFAAKSIKVKSENTATATNAFTQSTTTTTATTKALLECRRSNIKKESTPPATATTTATPAAAASADAGNTTTSFAPSFSSSSSSSSSSAWSTIEDANSNGGASADEEPTIEREPPKAATTTAAKTTATASSSEQETSLSMIMTTPRPVLLTAVNPHIICHLCQGYLINATTIVECLHSFCHNCLINHLHKERYCPRCEMVINNAKPNIKSDTTLQAIVYKLVPGLYERELMRKRAFYKDRPQEAALATPEQRGDDTEHLIFSPSDDMSLSLEYAELGELSSETEVEFGDTLRPRYLQCPAMCRVSHLKKFVYDKFEIDAQRFSIDIMYKVKTIVLLDYYTLMDIAYIYTWKRDAPMRFYFRVYESPKPLIKPPPPPAPVVIKAPVKQEPLTEAPATPPSPPAAPPTVSPAPPAPPLLTPPVLVVKTATPSPPLLQPARIKVEQQTTTQDEFRIVPKLNSPTDQPLKLVINRQSVEKREKSPHDKHHHHHSHHHNHYSPKGSSHKSLPSPTTTPSYNKEEPNIKLKIDLSKHNSVTIINMSDPDRREIVKPLKPEKESRSKSKKDKDGSPKSSSHSSSSSSSSERKRKSPSPLTVPPLTIRTDRILSPNGVRTVLSPRVTSGACHEDPKSAFLKSFALTPIKVKVESPERSNGHSHPKPHLDDSLLMKPPSSMAPKSIASSKRKSKEPIKAISSKKPKLSPPLPREDFKIRLPAAAAPAPAPSADKPLMPPPSGKPPIAAARHKSSATPQLPAPLQSPALPFSTPPHHQGMQMAPPGNRTPIAKRYQPILPKASRPNPFANIPSDVNRLLKDAGTEIKSIASQAKPHIYGPKSQELKMGPPPAPVSKSNSSSNNSNNNNNKSNNYLNLALFNASKSKGKEAPPGCRTPMYTPNSPIYSPSSPQYVPNYNIPTMPTYKYTPKPTSTTNTTPTSSTTTTSSNNYLQNMLNGSSNNSGLGGLFPSPPIKADQNTNPGSAEDAPEKQQVKVKSLLNSCNINIPSSLSITISRDNGDASSPSNAAHAKHKSPVNNYIEIVKLPDQPAAPTTAPPASSPTLTHIEKEPAVKKLPAPPSKTIPSPQHLLARMTPPQMSNPTTTTTVVPPKSSPKLAAPKPPAVLTPQQFSDKKTPSPEKRSASSLSPNSGENKSPKSPKSSQALNGSANGGDPAAKKFRPILPRQNAAAAGGASELSPKLSAQPPSLSPGYNNNNNANNNKKVPASKKSPNGANAKLMLNGGGTPTAPKPNALQKKKHAATPPATKMPPPSTAHPHLPNMNAPLGIASAANQLDLSNFLMRAQAAQAAQVAAQAANQSNLLYNFGPSMYNYQQAYLMEQLSRMQRAGNEVFNDYLQKLKSNASSIDEQQHSKSVMPMLPTVTLPTATMQGGAGGGAASPKTSPHATAAKLTPAATPALAKRQPSPRPQAAATSNNNNNNNNAMTKTK